MLITKPHRMKTAIFIVLSLWAATLAAVLWVDKPLALWVHSSGCDSLLQLRVITEYLPMLLMSLVIILIICQYWNHWRFAGLGISIYFYITLRLSTEVKVGLKVLFGRYWPKTWINNNISLIHDNVFGFNWLHGINNQGSFPSGHSTFVTFCCVWLLVVAPSFRYLWYFILILIPACLIILDYHFLGDCLSGISLGYLLAILSIWCLERYWPKIIQRN